MTPETIDPVRIGIVSISDRASSGVYEDKGLPALKDWLTRALKNPITFEPRLIPDEKEGISAALIELVDAGCSLVLTTGGTGPAPRDVTPEATLAVAHKEMPGFGEQMRQVSLRFVPTAILSRQCAVIRDKSLIINLPGQPKSIQETLEGPEGRGRRAARARHLRGRAVLRGFDRRALPRDERRGLQGLAAEVGHSHSGRCCHGGLDPASIFARQDGLRVEPAMTAYLPTSCVSFSASKHSFVAASSGTQSPSLRAAESFSIACHSSAIWWSCDDALSIRPFIAWLSGSSSSVMP